MSESKFKTERAARAWELVAEGCTAGDFDLLEIMVLREEHPGLAREADEYLTVLLWRHAPANVSAAVNLAERGYRRAMRSERGGKATALQPSGGNPAPSPAEEEPDGASAQLENILDGRPALAAWGICRLMKAGLLLRDEPATVARVGEIYRSLLNDLNRGEIRNLARLGKRKAGKLDTDSTD